MLLTAIQDFMEDLIKTQLTSSRRTAEHHLDRSADRLPVAGRYKPILNSGLLWFFIWMYVNRCVQVGDDARLLVNLFSFINEIYRVKPRLVISVYLFLAGLIFKGQCSFPLASVDFFGGWERFKRTGVCTPHCQPKCCHQRIMSFHVS